MKSTFISVVTVFVLLFGLLQCTKDKTPTPPEPCDPNKVYFKNDVLPIVSTSCAKSGCHDASSHVEGLNLSTYEGIMEIVKPGDPGNSEIMEMITETDLDDRMPPDPAPALSQEQIDKISKWISQGALNNFCVADTACSTGTVTYSKDITAALSNCQSCHSGSAPSGGVNLSNHAGVKTVGDNGKLYNAVSQNGQAQSMPPSPAPKLSTCDISKIKSWVDAGCPNN